MTSVRPRSCPLLFPWYLLNPSPSRSIAYSSFPCSCFQSLFVTAVLLLSIASSIALALFLSLAFHRAFSCIYVAIFNVFPRFVTIPHALSALSHGTFNLSLLTLHLFVITTMIKICDSLASRSFYMLTCYVERLPPSMNLMLARPYVYSHSCDNKNKACLHHVLDLTIILKFVNQGVKYN